MAGVGCYDKMRVKLSERERERGRRERERGKVGEVGDELKREVTEE